MENQYETSVQGMVQPSERFYNGQLRATTDYYSRSKEEQDKVLESTILNGRFRKYNLIKLL